MRLRNLPALVRQLVPLFHTDEPHGVVTREAWDWLDAAERAARREKLWVLTREREAGREIVYCIAPTSRELWQRVVGEELMGTGQTFVTLRAAGWRARRCVVLSED